MIQDTKRITRRAFLIYAAINVFVYITSLSNDTVGLLLEYINYYVYKTVSFLAPPIIAVIVLPEYARCGIKKALPMLAAISSARAFYTVPDFYISFFYDYSNNSAEAFLFSILASALTVALTVCGGLISIAFAVFVLKFLGGKKKSEVIAELPTLLDTPSSTDFLARHNLPILTFVLLRFGYSLVIEIIDTVSFFITYRSNYTTEEILTILTNYVLLFVLSIVAYLSCIKIKNAAISTPTEHTESTIEE